MHACQVDHPQIVLAAEELRRVADALAIVPYDEKTGAGDLRYAWFKTDGRDVLLTLVTAGEDSRAATELPERLRRPAGIAWSIQPGPGNNLRGQPPRVLRGAAGLALELAGAPLTIGPLGFLQPNPAVAALAYTDLLRDPSGEPLAGALAFDLYAGAGVTTTLLRAAFTEVRVCEAYPESAALLGVPPETAEQFLAREPTSTVPDLVIANPPREGLGPDVCAALLRLAAPRVHVMSCGPAGLARDLAALTAGGYRLTGLRAYDTLPHTPHIELVAWLAR
jgi:23S rRNA (uracil1939-C5)-methyltransferase